MLKMLISKAHSTPLWYYHRDFPVIIQADVSKHSLGAYLLQNGKPIPSPQSPWQTQYTNIKRELLAVVYICDHFHTYLYSFSFTV